MISPDQVRTQDLSRVKRTFEFFPQWRDRGAYLRRRLVSLKTIPATTKKPPVKNFKPHMSFSAALLILIKKLKISFLFLGL